MQFVMKYTIYKSVNLIEKITEKQYLDYSKKT